MILVIDRRACVLRHDGGMLRVECEGEATRRAPIAQLELVVVYGNPMAETAVWRALAKAGVPAVLLPARGADGPAVLGNGLATQPPLRRLQHRRAAHPTQALGLARWVVRQKLLGYDLPLARLGERHQADPALCAAFRARRDHALAALAAVAGHDEAMGIEGQVAHAWFGLLAHSLNPAWGFTGRNRGPPRNPVNALLSLGYTLVGAEVHQAVMACGLDPSLGFLHRPAAGRESMVLDLTEVFRGGVDDLVLRYIDPAGPKQADWYYRESEGCRLGKAARPRFFGTWAIRRAEWPYPLRPDPQADWPTGGLREQINGWIERLRAAMKASDPNREGPHPRRPVSWKRPWPPTLSTSPGAGSRPSTPPGRRRSTAMRSSTTSCATSWSAASRSWAAATARCRCASSRFPSRTGASVSSPPNSSRTSLFNGPSSPSSSPVPSICSTTTATPIAPTATSTRPSPRSASGYASVRTGWWTRTSKSSFDSIPHCPLLKVLAAFVDDAPALRLIARWLDQGAHVRSLLATPRGISQGAILSPLFCNLYLHRFDTALHGAKIPFVRFADDFLLFAPACEQAEKARDFAARQLERLDLGIHPEKNPCRPQQPRGNKLRG